MQTIGNRDLSTQVSLYIHVPFCTKKCPYCHFFVLPNKEHYHTPYLEALQLEFNQILPKLKGKEIVSVYFGGGTPSLLGPKAIDTILSSIRSSCSLTKECEVTLELNPEHATPSLMKHYQRIGINRVSIGVQSLDSSLLSTLERTHDVKKAIDAIDHTFHAGILNITIDLMYELPGQTIASWQRTLEEIPKLPITHLSLYNLVFEPNTVFYKKKKHFTPMLPSSDESLLMLEMAVSHLASAGLKRYEISAFAKEGYASVHNSGYWTARPFLGLGPSAFSYWDQKRFQNVCDLRKYQDAMRNKQSAIFFEEELIFPDNIKELLAVEMRLLCGVNLAIFEKKHQCLLSPEIHSSLHTLKEKGWIEQQGSIVKLTKEGLLFYDSVAEEII